MGEKLCVVDREQKRESERLFAWFVDMQCRIGRARREWRSWERKAQD
jgi:hypothetical protein